MLCSIEYLFVNLFFLNDYVYVLTMTTQESTRQINRYRHGLLNVNISMDWDQSVQFHGTVHTATLAVCTLLVIFVLILGTFGNGMVILSALQCRKLRSNFDILVFNLAGADFIICLCLSPTFLFLLFSDPPSPREFCGGYLFATSSCGLLSLLTLVAIAAHRQSWLSGRVKGVLSTLKTACIILAIYTVGLCASVGGTLHVTTAWVDSYVNCRYIMNSNDIKSNNVVLFFISPVVIISIIVIITSYSAVAKAVRIQTYLRVKSLQPLLKPVLYRPIQTSANVDSTMPVQELQQSFVLTSKSKPPLLQCSCCSCKTALDKENKAVTMCFVVIIIITLCWTPLVVSHFIELVLGESIILFQVKLCGIALVFLNSALDPYMYAHNTGPIKQRYGRVFCDMVRCNCSITPRRWFRTLRAKSADSKTLKRLADTHDCVTVQEREPKLHKSSNLPKDDVINVKQTHTKDKNYKLLKRTYTNNILLYGGGHSCVPDNTETKKTIAQKAIINDVRTLVPKSFCHDNVPDDQSLIDS